MVNMVDKAIGSAGAWFLENNFQQERTDGTALSTSEWMVLIGSAGFAGASALAAQTSSGTDLTTCVELFRWRGCGNRDFRGPSVGNALSSASLKHSYVEIQIPIGWYLPPLETMMYNATNVDPITFIRLGMVDGATNNGTPQEIQNIMFNNCQFVYVEQRDEVIILVFSFVLKTNVFNAFDRTGQAMGTQASTGSVDFTTGAITGGSS